MKKSFHYYAALCMFIPFISIAESTHIHRWEAGSTANKRTAINVTNVCNSHSAIATITFWNANGSPLANKNLDGIHTTDVNGQITINLAPKNSKTVQLSYQYMAGSGHAEVSTGVVSSSEISENIKCLIGQYQVWLTVTNNPYDGGGYAHLINNGNVF